MLFPEVLYCIVLRAPVLFSQVLSLSRLTTGWLHCHQQNVAVGHRQQVWSMGTTSQCLSSIPSSHWWVSRQTILDYKTADVVSCRQYCRLATEDVLLSSSIWQHLQLYTAGNGDRYWIKQETELSCCNCNWGRKSLMTNRNS